MKNLNVLMLTPDYPPGIYGGVGTHVYQLAQELINKDCNVTVIEGRCDLYVTEEYEEKIENSVKVIRFKQQPELHEYYQKEKLDYFTFRWAKNNLTMLPPIIKYLENKSFDIIHTHDLFTALIYDAIKTVYKLPSVASIHARSAKITSFDDSSRRYTRINADRIIAVSNALKEEIIERYGEETYFPYVEVVHNGVELSNDLEVNGCYIEKKLITYCGRLFHTKGCDILIRSFAKLVNSNSRYSDYGLNIIGDGPLLEEMRNLAKDLNVSGQIVFSGFVPHKEARRLIKSASLHIVPSTYEPFGLSALEGMSEGVCVIASNTGGIKEFIQDGENGMLVTPGDVDSLTDAIEYLLDNPIKKKALAEQGLLTAKDNNWSNVAKKTKEIYLEVIENKGNY
ncbi:glycosyltransferase family 4 protein [Paenibacillus sp. FSL R7-0337]|uniref:glycosyltransferase family 4 protein n=1 Tax=Paenibacillus sp. FSL R7-0337 TaxID=1926588 RepID=UPI00096CB654|nr:glycosyltransferase family 4 protein [Paenibacillus sp. FSL R7-0337]OMF98469.1 hypothetical protein BK147_09535 [Paenibacillus sp. FSL R7-0337]